MAVLPVPEVLALSALNPTAVLKLPLVLLVAREHPLRSADELWLRDRLAETLISLPAHEPVAHEFRQGLAKLRVEWPAGIEVSSLELVETYVAGGFGNAAAGGDTELHLMLSDEAPPAGPHFCLAVDELEALRARLEAAGVSTRDGTPLVGRPRFTCRDPFGNLVELARIEG